jgi:hypothetical protein
MRKSAALLIWTACCAHAQLNRGTLTGVVTDPSGAAVPSVQITAVHTATGSSASTVTTDGGNYTLPSLIIGNYRVTAEAAGFKRAVRENLELNAGATMRLDIALEIGSVGESILVEARASALETETTRVATSITNKLVEDLPLQVDGAIRSVFNLALVAPEAKTQNGFRLGGGQGAGWEMSMDGMPLTSASAQYQNQRAPLSSVPIDAISEFTVETSGMKAEYGRAMGFVSFETKSGTNQLHGNLFEFLRNNALDARGFFAQRTPVLKQHDFGGTVGGPVYMPKIYDGRNKTFFFVSYQGFRNRAGNNPQFLTIPLPEMYEGDFRGWTRVAGGNTVVVPIYDPASTRPNPSGSGFVRDAFANNQIPRSRFSQVAQRYIALRPAEMVPNQPGPLQNYFRAAGGVITPWNKGSVRLDHQLTAKDRVSFLGMKGKWEDLFGAAGAPGLPAPFHSGSIWARSNQSARFSWDRTITTRVLNSLRVSAQTEKGLITALNSVNPEDKWNDKLKIPNVPGPDRGLPPLAFNQYTGWSSSAWGGDAGRNINITNDLSAVTGRHSFKGGFFHARDTWDGYGQHRPNGSFNFSNLATSVPGDQSLTSGNAFASFLLGYVTQTGLETPRYVRQEYHYWGGYFQDDWRVTSTLTLNLGVRYEFTPPIRGGAITGLQTWENIKEGTVDGFSNFDPTAPNPGAGGRPGALVFSGNGPGRLGKTPIFDSWPWAFSPRIGLAWQMRPGTVMRMYGGRSFGAVKTSGGSTHFEGFILNINYVSNDNSINDFPTLLDRGLPPWPRPPFIDPTFSNDMNAHFWQRSDAGRPPEFWTWNYDLQKQLKGNVVLSAGYTGTKGTRLGSSILRINQIDPKYVEQYGINLLRSNINSAAARAAGIPIPYPGFNSTVQRALQPFPQYQNVITNGGQPASIGERAGNSTYHALILKADKRYSSGLTLLASYVLSKMFSDSDTAQIDDSNVNIDHYNRKLGKTLSDNDQTHMTRFAFTYDLPVGKGRALGLSGAADKVLGGWNVAGFLNYESGTPIEIGSGYSPIGTGSRPFITSYDGWRAAVSGEKFDPFKDVWWNSRAFNQGISTAVLNERFGNATRLNPKTRTPWVLNENVTLGKNVNLSERVRFTLRLEGFNIFNRVRWGSPNNTWTSPQFGLVRSQANAPRRMQIGLKLQF